MSDALTHVLVAVSSVTGKELGSLSGATLIEVLKLDSLDEVEVLMTLEESYEVEIDQTQVNHCRTLGDIAALVMKNKGSL